MYTFKVTAPGDFPGYPFRFKIHKFTPEGVAVFRQQPELLKNKKNVAYFYCFMVVLYNVNNTTPSSGH